MQKILLIYTGGTIGMVKDAQGALVPFRLENILSKIPALKDFPAQIDTLSVAEPKDSANLVYQDWQALGGMIHENYEAYEAFVVLHGTDTMAYTASALSFMFQNLTKPIVFTGSQLPIDDPRSDAAQNVMESLTAASLIYEGKPQFPEVSICFGSKLLRANRTQKFSSERFQAFDTLNFPPLAHFGVGITINKAVLYQPDFKKPTLFQDAFADKVLVTALHPGFSQQHLELLLTSDAVEVLVLQTYGAGTFMSLPWFVNFLKQAKAQGKMIINKSQCVHGSVQEGLYAAGADFESLGMLSAKSMTLEAVVTKSMYLLGVKNQKIDFAEAFKTSFSGETD